MPHIIDCISSILMRIHVHRVRGEDCKKDSLFQIVSSSCNSRTYFDIFSNPLILGNDDGSGVAVIFAMNPPVHSVFKAIGGKLLHKAWVISGNLYNTSESKPPLIVAHNPRKRGSTTKLINSILHELNLDEKDYSVQLHSFPYSMIELLKVKHGSQCEQVYKKTLDDLYDTLISNISVGNDPVSVDDVTPIERFIQDLTMVTKS